MHRLELCIINLLSPILNIRQLITTIMSLHCSASYELGKLVMDLRKSFFRHSIAHL